jgi:hypothetical protein
MGSLFPDKTFREMETSCGRKFQQYLGSREPEIHPHVPEMGL